MRRQNQLEATRGLTDGPQESRQTAGAQNLGRRDANLKTQRPSSYPLRARVAPE
jgi:hypothetical protein